MGADAFLVIYGLRLDMGNWETNTIDYALIGQLETEEHPLLISAEAAGLETCPCSR